MTEHTERFYKRLVELLHWGHSFQGPGCTRQAHMAAKLARRAWRPLYAQLKAEYEHIWGKNCTYSYFFPDHTWRSLWWQALEEIRNDTPLA